MAEGMAKGMTKGMTKGKDEEKLATAQRMKAKGYATEVIAELTELSIEEIDKL